MVSYPLNTHAHEPVNVQPLVRGRITQHAYKKWARWPYSRLSGLQTSLSPLQVHLSHGQLAGSLQGQVETTMTSEHCADVQGFLQAACWMSHSCNC